MIKTWMPVAIVSAVVMILSAGCTPANTQVKNQGFDNTTPVSAQNGYEERSYDFSSSERQEEPASSSIISSGKESQSADNSSASYTQADRAESFFQKGLASWYGREFDGKITASGELFNMNDFTAAHKTLPFGTVVEVTNIDTGKTVRARINDRGPYKGSRIIDLSHGAARQIGILQAGEAMVGVRIIKSGNGAVQASSQSEARNVEASNSYTSGGFVSDYKESSAGSYSLQAGAFYSLNNATALKERVEALTGGTVRVVSEGYLHKVRVEGIASRTEADNFKRRLSSEDISSFVIENR